MAGRICAGRDLSPQENNNFYNQVEKKLKIRPEEGSQVCLSSDSKISITKISKDEGNPYSSGIDANVYANGDVYLRHSSSYQLVAREGSGWPPSVMVPKGNRIFRGRNINVSKVRQAIGLIQNQADKERERAIQNNKTEIQKDWDKVINSFTTQITQLKEAANSATKNTIRIFEGIKNYLN